MYGCTARSTPLSIYSAAKAVARATEIMKRRSRVVPLSPDADGLTVQSADGAIKIVLLPCAVGIHVQRVQLRIGCSRVVQSTVFADEDSFVRWCDADRLKFAYPLVYTQLRRNGCALLARARQPEHAAIDHFGA
jgi:hypothetical protein